MECDVGVETEQPQQKSRADAEKCWNRFVAETGKNQVEPDDVGLMLAGCAE